MRTIALLLMLSAALHAQKLSELSTLDTTPASGDKFFILDADDATSLKGITFTNLMGGNAATASALAANPTDCGANLFAQSIAANGNLTCGAIGDADVPDNITVTLAATATALAANPADCSAGLFATTIAANGALTCGAVAYADVTGTPTLRYQTVDDEDTPLAQRATINFEGAGVSCADDTDQTTCTIAGGSVANSSLPWSRSWRVATSSAGGARIAFGDGLSTTSADEPAESVSGIVGFANFSGTSPANNSISTMDRLPSYQGGLDDVDFIIQGRTDGSASTGDVQFQLTIGCFSPGDTAIAAPPSTVAAVVDFNLNAAANSTMYLSSVTGVDISSVCAAGEEIYVLWARNSDDADDDYADVFSVTSVTIEVIP
jgi:hypothetical protein